MNPYDYSDPANLTNPLSPINPIGILNPASPIYIGRNTTDEQQTVVIEGPKTPEGYFANGFALGVIVTMFITVVVLGIVAFVREGKS